jgi:CheY-like chemotaxis protein
MWTIVLTFLIPGIILFIFLNLLSRELYNRLQAQRRRAEREQALSRSLQLDFTRESKTLKRVEVEEPAARILCVDDEAVVLDSLRKILVLDGYSVDTVETGQEALGLVQARDYDFVFTDLKMPSMSGNEVTKAVKHLRPDIDVVIITGYATVDSAVECMKYGAMDYIEKPFTEEELHTFVRHALIRREDRVQRQLRPQVHITGPAGAARRSSGEFSIPGGVLVSTGHCWASLSEEGTAKIGLDDFAAKLIGSIDSIEFPEVGKSVAAGEPLFGIRQDGRSWSFAAPLSGKVLRVNNGLQEDTGRLARTAYGDSWICAIEGGNLDAELPKLKIGQSAVDFFQAELERFETFLREAQATESVESAVLAVGAIERLDGERWDQAFKAFFAR